LLEQSLSRGLAQYPLDSDTLFEPDRRDILS
jgi:hypothetical protein